MLNKENFNYATIGCTKENRTAVHLIDILCNSETELTGKKAVKLLKQYYSKMVGLIGTGKYQEFYMTLVMNDTVHSLEEKTMRFQLDKTKQHINSLILILFRSMRTMDFDINNQFPCF